MNIEDMDEMCSYLMQIGTWVEYDELDTCPAGEPDIFKELYFPLKSVMDEIKRNQNKMPLVFFSQVPISRGVSVVMILDANRVAGEFTGYVAMIFWGGTSRCRIVLDSCQMTRFESESAWRALYDILEKFRWDLHEGVGDIYYSLGDIDEPLRICDYEEA